MSAGDGQLLSAGDGGGQLLSTGDGGGRLLFAGDGQLLSAGDGGGRLLFAGDGQLLSAGDGDGQLLSAGDGQLLSAGDGDGQLLSTGDGGGRLLFAGYKVQKGQCPAGCGSSRGTVGHFSQAVSGASGCDGQHLDSSRLSGSPGYGIPAPLRASSRFKREGALEYCGTERHK